MAAYSASVRISTFCSSGALKSDSSTTRHGLCELRMAPDQLLGEMARGRVALAAVDRTQRRHLLAAAQTALREEAARMERAPGRPVDQRRRLTGDRPQPLLVLRQLRQRVHEP